MINKETESVFGTKHKPKEGSIARTQVTYWNLIRSYILLHYPNAIVAFIAKGMDCSMDFLHYSYVYEFNTVEEMEKFIFNEEEEYDDPENYLMIIKSANGEIKTHEKYAK